MRRAFLLCSLFLLASCAMPDQTANQSNSSSSLSPLEAVEGGNGSSRAAANDQTEERVLSGGLLVTGKSDAPVTLLLFTNFSCRYCRDFHERLSNVAKPYLDGGELRIVTATYALEKYPRSARDGA